MTQILIFCQKHLFKQNFKKLVKPDDFLLNKNPPKMSILEFDSYFCQTIDTTAVVTSTTAIFVKLV